MAVTEGKKLSPKQQAKKRVVEAKKAFAKGGKGSSLRLDKAIAAYAKASCTLKTKATKKTSTATIGKKKVVAKKKSR